MKKLRRILPLVLVFTMLLSISAFADWKKLKNESLVKKQDQGKAGFTQETADAVLYYAYTQIGYKGVKPKSYKFSYWVYEWGPGKKANPNRGKNGNWGNWCSEFAWWCLVKAKVMTGTENINDSGDMKKVLSKKGKTIFNKGSNKLNLDKFRPGDVVLLDHNKDGKADHTAIISEPIMKGNKLRVVEGNANENKAGNTFVQEGAYSTSQIMYVGRPRYKVRKGGTVLKPVYGYDW